jgi:hypothetical protein
MKRIVSFLANVFNHWSAYKVLNPTEATALISKNLSKTYEIGILEDWDSTSDVIYRDGKIVHGANPTISSSWGTPVLRVVEDNLFIPVWKYSGRVRCWRHTRMLVI